MTTTTCCPDAAHYRVRALGLRPSRSGPSILRELAHKDALVSGTECHVPDLPDYEWACFDPGASDQPAVLPRCTLATLAATVWTDPPTVLLAHDVSRAREAFGPGLTSTLPWICTRRVAARLWRDPPTLRLAVLVVWRELHAGPRFDELCAGDQPVAVVEAALILLLFCHQLELAGSLARLIEWSATPAKTLWSAMPAPWDPEDDWERTATDDLWAWLRDPDTAADARTYAEAELDRRRRAGHRLPDPDLRIPRLLLPQVRPRPR